ncbi:MAG TPA: chloride channel protein [Streptosporangiaceae bacterium]|nr:chloride channel protein [Streptosporangiaceae bacterium]
MPPTADPVAVLRSRRYLVLLVLAGIIGVPVSAAAWGFLALVSKLQGWLFTSLPSGLGFHGEPVWWPLPLLGVAGILVGLTIQYLPGTGGHSPADGLQPGTPTPAELPGVFLAALASLALGAVIGPEAPLIALGGGLAAALLRLSRRPVPANATTVVAAAGAFAAISTLLGSPIVSAFLLMEMIGLGGASLELVLLPGLLAAGIGALIFVGLGTWSGLGTFSLAIPSLPHFAHPDVAEFGWAIVIGLAAAVAGVAIRRFALVVRPHVESRLVLATPIIGLAVAGLAIAYTEGTGKASSDVLFSGQDALGPLIRHASAYTIPALLLLLACKGLGYSLSMSAFRGGPVFPSLFLGAAGGIAMSHLPGLPLVPAVAMGIGATAAVMLRLPLTAVLLATLLLFSDGVAVMPVAILAVVVAYIASLWIAPTSWPLPGTATAATPAEGPRNASR